MYMKCMSHEKHYDSVVAKELATHAEHYWYAYTEQWYVCLHATPPRNVIMGDMTTCNIHEAYVHLRTTPPHDVIMG